MNNLNCKVIGDLLPLYIDQVCSEESRKLVEAHLKECESCRQELEQMKSRVVLESPLEEENPKKTLVRIRKAIKTKYVIIALCAVIVGGGLFAGYAFMRLMETPMSYEEAKLEVVPDKKDADVYNLMTNGPEYSCYYGEYVELREDEKYNYKELIIHLTSSPWTRTFGKKAAKSAYVDGFSSDPDYTNGYIQENDGSKKYDKTVAVYYQATPGSERHLLWEADWYKEKIEKEKATEQKTGGKTKQK